MGKCLPTIGLPMARNYTVNDEPIHGYRLIEFLGRGGFGEVWKAVGPGGTNVAVKLINLGNRAGQKELRSLRLVKRVRHPNLVPILAYWLRNDDGYLIDEGDAPEEAGAKAGLRDSYMEGNQPTELIMIMGLGDKSLHDRLEECRAEGKNGIPVEELLTYMEDSARAIDYLNTETHDLGTGPMAIHHCDIKPQNIMIVGNAAQVVDFGLARAMGDLRQTTMAASPAYAAPECLAENKPSGGTDQYSLAISYFELRTGSLPFEEKSSLLSIVTAHLNGELDLSMLTPAEEMVIRRATQREPADRYPTTIAMVRDLRRAIESQATETQPVDTSAVASSPRAPAAAPARDTARHAQRTMPKAQQTMANVERTMADVAGFRETEPLSIDTVPEGDPEPEAPPGKKLSIAQSMGILAGVVLLLAIVAGAVMMNLDGGGTNTASLQIVPPDPLNLTAGAEQKIVITLQLQGTDDPVEVQLDQLPTGVSSEPAKVSAVDGRAEFTLRAAADIQPAESKIQVLAVCGDLNQQTELLLSLRPLPVKVPKGFQAADGAKTVRVHHDTFYDRIVRETRGGERVVFILIPRKRRDEAETFYIMENKVWNGLFAEFATANPGAVKDDSWKKGALAKGKDVGIENKRLPVMRTSVEEAHECCVWLGGRLPSLQQWDTAAGLYESTERESPLTEAWDGKSSDAVGVNRALQGPLEVGTASLDRSPFGCRDMAGNGAEWTRDVFGVTRRTVPLDRPGEDDVVMLRGRSYLNPSPLKYEELRNPELLKTESMFYGGRDPTIGFRAVVEIGP